LSLKYHPDKSPTNAAGNPVTTVYFKRMDSAYKVSLGERDELIAEFEIPSLE
jgi:DnaJ-class molecular chaperone